MLDDPDVNLSAMAGHGARVTCQTNPIPQKIARG